MSNNHLERIITFSNEVDYNSVGDIIHKIVHFNVYDDLMEAQKLGYERPPILLIVNSPGGEVYSGWGIVDAIETSTTPVVTVCYGVCASMGFAIFLAGHTRFMGAHSYAMYHEVASWNGGKLTRQQLTVKNLENLQALYDLYVEDKTKINKDTLNKVKKEQDDWFIDAQEALDLGICDFILDGPINWFDNGKKEEL